eukprot:CAMPEP_0170179294 /NCGR_PEP_ID=MMETSP0040_2-20121228/17238_1 /TAXON_ID=641309 /ORGANISM="Lotharella oceanica, Strain CCMP622" /LENGTH=140 /DNA_ID=CAMNT_0010423297 /DNA_START=52 /DNA_END=473 /DNA_ORIENTATION=+
MEKDDVPGLMRRIRPDSPAVSKSHVLSRLRGGMQIMIKSLSGRSIPLDVQPGESINSIKKKIQEKEGVPIDQQRLIYGGKQLEEAPKLTRLQHPKGFDAPSGSEDERWKEEEMEAEKNFGCPFHRLVTNMDVGEDSQCSL